LASAVNLQSWPPSMLAFEVNFGFFLPGPSAQGKLILQISIFESTEVCQRNFFLDSTPCHLSASPHVDAICSPSCLTTGLVGQLPVRLQLLSDPPPPGQNFLEGFGVVGPHFIPDPWSDRDCSVCSTKGGRFDGPYQCCVCMTNDRVKVNSTSTYIILFTECLP
jgi:hypothetical protein